MARTAAFRSFARMMTAALLAERRHCSAVDALGAIQELASKRTSHSISRRQFLLGAGATGATLAMGTMTGLPLQADAAKPLPSSLSVGIVGAGLAGLACADTLKARGIRASVYEAAARAGGRCWSLLKFLPWSGRRTRRRAHRQSSQDDAGLCQTIPPEPGRCEQTAR
jgi:monoamine oxidase